VPQLDQFIAFTSRLILFTNNNTKNTTNNENNKMTSSANINKIAIPLKQTDELKFNGICSWGWNNLQLLQTDEVLSTPKPIIVHIDCTKIKQFVSGGSHAAFLMEDDRIFTFGRNQSGQLGIGDTVDREDPVELKCEHFIDDKVIEIACGDRHTMFVTQKGFLYACGHNFNYQLGLGHNNSMITPVIVDNLKHKKIDRAYCGSRHTVVCTERGEMYSAGYGYFGQLGHGDNRDQMFFKKIDIDWKVRSISCKEHLTVCISEDWGVYQWGGKGPEDPAAKEYNEPRFMFRNLQGRRVLEVAASAKHCLCRTSDGSVYSWGQSLENLGYIKYLKNVGDVTQNPDRLSQLVGIERDLMSKKLDLSNKYILKEGYPFTIYKNHFFNNDKIVSIACGCSANYCVTEGGQLYVFGSGLNGDCGTGSKESKIDYPQIVSFGSPNHSKVLRVVAGNYHAFALMQLQM
jgi:alpha-tubulin suppressor-like RCC1 family protein